MIALVIHDCTASYSSTQRPKETGNRSVLSHSVTGLERGQGSAG